MTWMLAGPRRAKRRHGGADVKRRSSNAASVRRRLALAARATMLAPPPAGIAAQTAPQVPRAPTREEVERPTAPARLPPPRLTVDGGIERAPCVLDSPAYRDIRF